MKSSLIIPVLGICFCCDSQTPSGKITFYRPDDPVVLKLTLVCDGKEVVKLSRKRVFTLTVDANTSHQCSDKTDESRHVLPLVFAVNPGEERFVRAEFYMPSEFMKVKPRLTLQESGWHPDANDPEWREIRPMR
jgi:hypothetical protein